MTWLEQVEMHVAIILALVALWHSIGPTDGRLKALESWMKRVCKSEDDKDG